MNIAFDITHPADVHQFKNCIKSLRRQGERIKVTARDTSAIKELLQQNGIEFIVRKSSNGFVDRIKNIIPIVFSLYKSYKPFHPDLLVGSSGNIYIPQVAKLLRKKSIIFDDTEHTRIQNLIAFPLADYVCTPACYSINIGKKQVRYQGSKELAYLHPNNYQYDSIKFKNELLSYLRQNNNTKILNEIDKNKKVILLRLVAWDAAHDLFRNRTLNWQAAVEKLQQLAAVIVVAAGNGYSGLLKNNVHLPPNKFHDLISFSDLVISEGATTAAEAAVLGKPTVYCNKLRVGYIDEYDQRYNLVQQINDEKKLINRVEQYLGDENLSKKFTERQQRLLSDKINVNQWMLEFITELALHSNSRKNGKQNIYYISNFDPNYTRAGGVETYVKEISHSLIEDNFNINIIGVSEVSKNAKRNLRPAFQKKLNNTNSMKFSNHIPVFFNKKVTLCSSFEFLSNLVIKAPFLKFDRADILHIQRPDFALPFIFFKNKKLCSIHGHPAETIACRKSRWISLTYNLIERISLPFMDKLVFVDHYNMSKYKQKYPHLTDKMTIVPSCVGNIFHPLPKDEISNLKAQFGLEQGETVLLLVVRIEKEKNIFEIIKIFNSLTINHPKKRRARFLIVGYGILFDKLKEEIKKNGGDDIILLNHVKHEKLPQIFNIANVTILFSQTEGLPMVVLESLACGTPVVGNRVGDLPRVIKDGYNGYLVDADTVQERLSQLLENPPDWTENCVNSAAPYRTEKFIQKIKQLYEDVNTL